MAFKSRAKQFRTERKSSGFDKLLSESLLKFNEDVQTKVLRSAARAGALVIYNELILKAPEVTGTLKGSIYHYFNKDESTPMRQSYLVGPNKRDAPHWANVEFGHYRYNKSIGGYWQKSKSKSSAKVKPPGKRDTSVHDLPGALPQPIFVPPHPFLRPSWEAKAQEALQAMGKRAFERIREIQAGTAKDEE